jgi:hypothetical protein
MISYFANLCIDNYCKNFHQNPDVSNTRKDMVEWNSTFFKILIHHIGAAVQRYTNFKH